MGRMLVGPQPLRKPTIKEVSQEGRTFQRVCPKKKFGGKKDPLKKG